jgi:hypothetical protein
LAILTTKVAISGPIVGRPTFPRLPSYFLAISCQCQRISVSAYQRIRRDERADLPQRAPANQLRFRRQAAAFRVGEPEPLRTEPIAENPVLLAEVIDDRRLLPVGPMGERRGHQMKRMDRHHHRIGRTSDFTPTQPPQNQASACRPSFGTLRGLFYKNAQSYRHTKSERVFSG